MQPEIGDAPYGIKGVSFREWVLERLRVAINTCIIVQYSEIQGMTKMELEYRSH